MNFHKTKKEYNFNIVFNRNILIMSTTHNQHSEKSPIQADDFPSLIFCHLQLRVKMEEILSRSPDLCSNVSLPFSQVNNPAARTRYVTLAAFAKCTCRHVRLAHCSRECNGYGENYTFTVARLYRICTCFPLSCCKIQQNLESSYKVISNDSIFFINLQ